MHLLKMCYLLIMQKRLTKIFLLCKSILYINHLHSILTVAISDFRCKGGPSGLSSGLKCISRKFFLLTERN